MDNPVENIVAYYLNGADSPKDLAQVCIVYRSGIEGDADPESLDGPLTAIVESKHFPILSKSRLQRAARRIPKVAELPGGTTIAWAISFPGLPGAVPSGSNADKMVLNPDDTHVRTATKENSNRQILELCHVTKLPYPRLESVYHQLTRAAQSDCEIYRLCRYNRGLGYIIWINSFLLVFFKEGKSLGDWYGSVETEWMAQQLVVHLMQEHDPLTISFLFRTLLLLLQKVQEYRDGLSDDPIPHVHMNSGLIRQFFEDRHKGISYQATLNIARSFKTSQRGKL
ncbi:MAG: hypothetical protein M1814_003051 [Vezdaea aestivalis]|nr:MAG: hypothetical protein M1814_003051 [Vezdaea aestivalis]